jgi:uncharacterized membrane protein
MTGEAKRKGVPKQRLDALSDGVFAFAMTLLAIGLDLPSSVTVTSANQLLGLLAGLQDNLLVYVISFVVLGARWIRIARDHGTDLWCSYAYARAVIVHLFFVTLTPFATKIVGNYGDLWPAICLYAATTICAALSSMHAANLLAVEEKTVRTREDRFDLMVLIATALLSCAIAFVAPAYSMYAYLLNAATPLVHRMWRKA